MSTRKAALVTGGARRVGRAIALHLANEGWDVAIHYNGSGVEAEATASEIRSECVDAKIYQAELGDPASINELMMRFCSDFPRAALLVNNASMFEHDTLETLNLEIFDQQFAVNTRAPILLAKAFHERAGDGSCIVNMLDQKISNLTPDYFSYTISKDALHTATLMLAMALAPKTRVNAIAPGIVLQSGDLSEQEFASLHVNTLLGVGVSMDEICRTVSFFAGSPAITGQVLTIDGGRHLIRPYPYKDLPKE